MEIHLTPELILGIIGTSMSIIAMVYSWINSGKRQEHRLTKLEANQFTAEDRRCLHDVETKMNTIWKFFERDLPAALTLPHTIRLDELLLKAKDGLGKMTISEARELFSLIKAEDTECKKTETQSIRGLKIAMYRSFLEHELTALNILI